jgi:hypothetical protein
MTPRTLQERIAALLDVLTEAHGITRIEAAGIIADAMGRSRRTVEKIGAGDYRHRNAALVDGFVWSLRPLETKYREPLRLRREFIDACRQAAA